MMDDKFEKNEEIFVFNEPIDISHKKTNENLLTEIEIYIQAQLLSIHYPEVEVIKNALRDLVNNKLIVDTGTVLSVFETVLKNPEKVFSITFGNERNGRSFYC
jgi:hypothetical protein